MDVHVFKMILEINEQKTVIKHFSYDFKGKVDRRKCNLNQESNNKYILIPNTKPAKFAFL